jgi:hypothetical protein
VNFIHHLSGNRLGVTNYSLKLVPFKHERSHIGDDLTLMRSDEGVPLKNINVSYNYWQLEGTINDPMFSLRKSHSLRVALLGLYSRKKGWYELLPSGSEKFRSRPSTSRWGYATATHGCSGFAPLALRCGRTEE